MGVDIEQHVHGTVAHSVLGVFNADAVGRKPAGMIMPEFMKGDRELRLLDDLLKAFGPVARVLEFAEGIGKYQVVVFPGPAVGLTGGDGCCLACLMDLQSYPIASLERVDNAILLSE